MRIFIQFLIIVCIVILIALTGIIQSNNDKIFKGGDIITFNNETPIKVNSEMKSYGPGTFVCTPEGMQKLQFYSVTQLGFIIILVPIFIIAVLFLKLPKNKDKENQLSY